MVMRRREGEKILIGDNIVVHISQIGRNKVKIGIEAPREIAIVAEEILRVSEENAKAAQSKPADIASFLARLAESRAAVSD
jgi:carbon storage regulator